MKRGIVGSIVMILFANMVLGQTVSGVVLDSTTQSPMAYVHIGVLGKNLGVISRDDGTFQIDLSEADSQDKLTFSSVGYHTQHVPQSSWKSAPLKVYLSPRIFTLREIVVEDSRLSDPVKLGR
ncbi:MAG: carboxypeptidase-like regulatory domain-containing protein [Cyclobacteriaceae bacterium]